MSKIEKGLRQLKRERIPVFSQILKADVEELQTLWLADKLFNLVQGEPMAEEALESIAMKIMKSNQ